MNATRTALAAAAAIGMITATAGVAQAAQTSHRTGDLAFSTRAFCRDDGTTRVRVKVENPTSGAREISYTITASTGDQKLYSTTVWEKTPTSVLQGFTVKPGMTKKFTAGDGNSDTGLFGRTFRPRAC